MRNRRRFLLLGAGVLLIAAALGIFFAGREPSYQGQPLSYWIRVHFEPQEAAAPTFRDSLNAINHIGEKAVPCLVRWIRYEPRDWNQKCRDTVNDVAEKLKVKWRWEDPAPGRAECALKTFELLGAKATAAIRDLARVVNDPDAHESAPRAARALGYIGPTALPALMTVLTNQQSRACPAAAVAITSMGTNARPAVPQLAQWTVDMDERVAVRVAGVLASLKLEPERVVQAMIQCLDRPSLLVRANAAEVLITLRTNAQPAVPVLLRHFSGVDEDQAELAARTLGRLQLEPTLVIPRLMQGLDDQRPLVRYYSYTSLAAFGELARAAVPALLRGLQNPEPGVRTLSTNALLKIAPDALTNTLSR